MRVGVLDSTSPSLEWSLFFPWMPCYEEWMDVNALNTRAVHYSVQERTGPKTDRDRTGPFMFGPVVGPAISCFQSSDWTGGPVEDI